MVWPLGLRGRQGLKYAADEGKHGSTPGAGLPFPTYQLGAENSSWHTWVLRLGWVTQHSIFIDCSSLVGKEDDDNCSLIFSYLHMQMCWMDCLGKTESSLQSFTRQNASNAVAIYNEHMLSDI